MRIVVDLLVDENFNAIDSIFFNSYKYIGDPLNACKIMSDLGADEIVFSRKKSPTNNFFYEFDSFDLNYIANCGLSVSLKGGINSFDEVEKYISSGFDRIGLNASKIHKNIDIIKQTVNKYGSQAIFCYYENHNKKIDLKQLYDALILSTKNNFGEFMFIDCLNDGKSLNYVNYEEFLNAKRNFDILSCFYGEVLMNDFRNLQNNEEKVDALILSTDLFRSNRNFKQALHSFDFSGVSQRYENM